MKKIGIAAFTAPGKELAGRIAKELEASCSLLWYEKNLRQWCGACFAQADALIFIGACGIAVRTIAPFLKSKTEDPAVIVLDEAGQYVISLLSGHIGGANEFALRIAALIGAAPVITTASDVRGKLAVDVFASKNGLVISDMKQAKEAAAALLREERVGFCCTGEMEGQLPLELTWISPDEVSVMCGERDKGAAGSENISFLIWASERALWPAGECGAGEIHTAPQKTLHLIPRVVSVGIGCRRGKPKEEICAAVLHVLEKAGIPVQALEGAASIDLKKEEEGILEACRAFGIPYTTYSASELAAVEGDFSPSEFVKKTTGVDNVCERAALLLAGSGGRLIRRKYAENGVTVALAVRKWRVYFEE